MPTSKFVDFRAVKAALSIERVLEHYNLLDTFKRSGDSLSGPCPIHKGSNPTQFRVSLSKNLWNCFSECKHGGNVLDFIARIENVSIHAAAQKAIVMLDEDDAGRTGREDIAVRLARFLFVKVHAFAEDGRQPEQLSAEEVIHICGGVP